MSSLILQSAYLKMQQSDEEMYIDVFERNKKIKRYCYYNNQLRKCINFNELAQPVSEIMFNGNELPYMQRGIHPHNGHPGWYFIFPYNKHFKNLSEVSSHVLSEIIKDEEDITVICDGPGSFNKLLAMEHTKIKKAIYIHTNHFEPPYNLGALVKKDHQYILDNASKVDYLVTPTNSQKRDISKEYPLINTITIPNYINLYNGPCEKDFTKNSFGVVCRLVEMKGIQDIISAMPYVLKEIPDACFEIYGEGPFKDNLVKQAEELNVSDNVLFHGYRSDLQTIFDGILFSISSSEYEGFGLSIAESLTYKTPVIAYDVNYGPSDLIKNDETGFLITHGNINEMAEKIIFLFNNKDKLKTMSGDAQIDINSRYSKKNISNLWQEIL
ncbi:glycosyltransferase [Vagococcus salmoninarum]|uniref:glycosyltransferase n=1 Tax=Vagococcus salmoninarum TaxID=2739 RepID=UPI00398B0473